MKYIEGSLLTVADTLSTAPLKNKKSEIDNAEITSHIYIYMNLIIWLVISGYNNSKMKRNKMRVYERYILNHIQNNVPNLIWSYFIH